MSPFDQFLRAQQTMRWHKQRPAPVRQQPRKALLPRVEMLERRLSRLTEHPEAREMVVKRWPADVPTPRVARETGEALSPTQLAAIARIAAQTEKEFGTPVSGEQFRQRLTYLPPDLLAIVEVTAKSNGIPAINSEGFTTWHCATLAEFLEAAELIHSERNMRIARAVDLAECDTPPEQMVAWVTKRHGAVWDRLQELEADTLIQILEAIADGYLADHPNGLVCQIENPDEILNRWGKKAALAEARRLAKLHDIPSPKSSAKALDEPIFAAALAAK